MNDIKKILIVEDETPLRRALVNKFIKEGFQVFEAKNGEEGLTKALKEHPRLILLDLIMPVMDGMTMLKKLREDKWGKSVKVVTLTNSGDESKVAEALEQGSYNYLIKSDWKIEDVVEIVKERLNIA